MAEQIEMLFGFWTQVGRIKHRQDSLMSNYFDHLLDPPFPQIDIIGAMVIVWMVRRSVLCNIVCNNCAQCNAYTYEQT